jgi:hypothetical protein
MNLLTHRSGVACLLGGAALLAASAASAQQSVSHSTWRQLNRPSRMDEQSYASPQSFALEIRFGPYRPDVDDEPALGGSTPYNDAFGGSDHLYFGLEADWLPLRIPYVGALGPGVGWGYTSSSGKATFKSTGEPSGQDTSLMVMPMHLSAVARFDELMRRTGIPIVPYAKLGLGFGLWSAGSASDTAKADGVTGKDTTWGMHLALGGMLSLNWLDQRSAAELDRSTGINHAYLFAEWMNANLSGLGDRPQMHIGDSTWVAGLAFDM